MEHQTLDISLESMIRFFLVAFVIYILFLTHEIVIWFFFALILSLLVDPVVNFLRSLRVPKFLAVILVYIVILGILGLVLYLSAPIFIFELKELSLNTPGYFAKINPLLKDAGIKVAKNFQDFTALVLVNLEQSSSSVFGALASFFGGVYATFVIFSLAFFISLEDQGTKKVLAFLAPRKYEGQIISLFERAQYKVSRWFGARIVSCVFVAVASFATFFLLGVPYPFILALICGVLNFIPYLGPTVSLILSVVFVGVSSSWIVAIYVLIILLIIQEIEAKALTPLLMKKFMDLPPVLVLLSLLAGGVMFGFLGTIFAVPVFGIIYEFTKEFLEKKREEITY